MNLYCVQLFAGFKEMVGRDQWELTSAVKLSANELLTRFFQAFPDLDGLKSVTRLAVNHRFASEDVALEPGDELALIPPVSGG